jgi:hypothetical protein
MYGPKVNQQIGTEEILPAKEKKTDVQSKKKRKKQKNRQSVEVIRK